MPRQLGRDPWRPRERAGMVACLLKPLAPETLLAAIADAFSAGLDFTGGGAAAVVRDEPASDDEASDLPALAVLPATLADLARLGGEDFLRELITQFLEEGKPIVASMAAAVENGDIHGFQREAHALASSAGNIGAAGVARLCRSWRKLETRDFALHGDDFLAELRREWSRVATQLNRNPAKSDPSRGATRFSPRGDAA